jgi:membrane fusion protein, multidrug efflux system
MASIPPDVVPQKPAGMSLRRKLLLGGLLLAILGVGLWRGIRYFTHDRFVESTDNAYVEADISIIAPKVQGYIRDVRVKDNQTVRQGDIIAIIDDTDYRAKLAQAQAAVETRRAAIDNVKASASRQQSAISAAQAEIDAKQADRNRAESDLKRFSELRKDKWISEQRYQSVEADARKLRANVSSAQADLRGQQGQLGVLSSQARVALASYKETLAALRVAELDVENTVLRAPVDGVIGNRAVRVGQYVRAGTLLMAVVPLTDVYVVANFKETQLHDVSPGQQVSLHFDAYPDVQVQAVVDSISPAAGSRFSMLPPENATGNFTKIVQRMPVKIVLQDVPATLRLTPGMSVEASIDTRQKSSAITGKSGPPKSQSVSPPLSVVGQ